MEVVYRCCCGIDVHKKVIVACLVNGGEQELREFGTTTSEIKTLANWLTESGCEMIAMESTGVFWKPLYNLFELMDLDAMIVNAAHMKALPGRKTDVKDAEWIADLLRHGLLKASYIPNREQRELREITPQKPDGRTLPGSKPSAKNSGRCQYQAGFCSERHHRQKCP